MTVCASPQAHRQRWGGGEGRRPQEGQKHLLQQPRGLWARLRSWTQWGFLDVGASCLQREGPGGLDAASARQARAFA